MGTSCDLNLTHGISIYEKGKFLHTFKIGKEALQTRKYIYWATPCHTPWRWQLSLVTYVQDIKSPLVMLYRPAGERRAGSHTTSAMET